MDSPNSAGSSPTSIMAYAAQHSLGQEFREGLDTLKAACRDAWRTGLLTGFNGNMSMRLGDCYLLVTATGVAKGHLLDGDIALVHLPTSQCLAGGKISSETPMHFAVYGNCPDARLVLHTHPAHLLALSLKLGGNLAAMLDIPLFEARAWKQKMSVIPALAPGSQELGDAVGRASIDNPAVFMAEHGLCVRGRTPAEVLGISEQLEHLAEMQLLLF